jgi:hypothetical protein
MDQSLADDLLVGVAAIAEYLGEPPRRVFYLAKRGAIPAFKLPGAAIWHARKSTLRQHIERLEGAGRRS